MKYGLSSVFSKARIITVGGGKGGVGKSTISAGIACHIAAQQKKTILIDADLAGANLHLSMGIRYPGKTLNDYITGRVASVSDILIDTTYPNIKLISGANGIHELTNPRFAQKQNMLASFRNLDADYVIVDVGAGADEDNTDFFSLSNHGVVIITNEPSSIENAYSFLKNSVLRKFMKMVPADEPVRALISSCASPRQGGFRPVREMLALIGETNADAALALAAAHAHFKPRLVVNMVKNKADVSVEENFRRIVKSYLDIDLTYVGYVVYDEAVPKSIKQITPLFNSRDSQAVACLQSISRNLMALDESHGRTKQ